MPKNKKLKRLIRARMKETGESYCQAKQALALRGESEAYSEDMKARKVGCAAGSDHGG